VIDTVQDIHMPHDRQYNVETESSDKLIKMLYDGIIRFNLQAKRAIKEKDIEKKVYWVNRSIAIITELIGMLDYTNENAYYLSGLYNYQMQLLFDVVKENNIKKLDECTNVFRYLMEH